jgi:hypothetical protein
MRVERASFKAIKYACINFHYAKRLPSNPIVAYSIFEGNIWCGCICFNSGIEGINKPYNLKMGQVAELVRVALNGKQSSTSKAISICLRLFKIQNPLVKIVISYADTDEGHIGTVYQASNWIFEQTKKTSNAFFCKKTGRQIHSRQVSKTGFNIQFGINKRCFSKKDVFEVKKGVKHKYIYPLDKSMVPLCKSLSKPYPKKAQHAAEALMDDATGIPAGEGVRFDPAAPKQA